MNTTQILYILLHSIHQNFLLNFLWFYFMGIYYTRYINQLLLIPVAIAAADN